MLPCRRAIASLIRLLSPVMMMAALRSSARRIIMLIPIHPSHDSVRRTVDNNISLHTICFSRNGQVRSAGQRSQEERFRSRRTLNTISQCSHDGRSAVQVQGRTHAHMRAGSNRATSRRGLVSIVVVPGMVHYVLFPKGQQSHNSNGNLYSNSSGVFDGVFDMVVTLSLYHSHSSRRTAICCLLSIGRVFFQIHLPVVAQAIVVG